MYKAPALAAGPRVPRLGERREAHVQGHLRVLRLLVLLGHLPLRAHERLLALRADEAHVRRALRLAVRAAAAAGLRLRLRRVARPRRRRLLRVTAAHWGKRVPEP